MIKKGDIVRCINDVEDFNDTSDIDLTVGKLYKVDYAGIMVLTIQSDDVGDQWEYAKERFINIADERNDVIDDILK